MKNRIQHFTLTLVVCFLLFNTVVFAQEEEQPHVFVVVTWRTVMPEDGNAAGRDSLLLEWVEAQKSNEKVLSSKNLRHRFGNDSHDWVVISEYASFADIAEAGKISQELTKKRWPDEKERQEFFNQLGKYFDGHSDEIFTGVPKFDK